MTIRNRLALPLLLLAAAPLLAVGDTAPVTYERVEFVTEVARVVANDQMNATLSVELSDRDPARLSQQIAILLNDAMKKAAAFPAVKASTGNQNTWPVYGPASNKLDGWRGRAEVRLEAKDFKAASELIARLQEKMQLSSLSFSVSPDTRRKVEDGLTAEAIAAFRGRADNIRSAWGAKGYRLVYMNLGATGAPPPFQPMMRAMKTMDALESAPAQDMAGGETRLVVNAAGSIELQP